MAKENNKKTENKGKKKKKISREKWIKIIAMSMIIIFLSGVFATVIGALISRFFPQTANSSNIIEYGADDFLMLAKEYEDKLKTDPTNKEYMLNLIQIYEQLAYQSKNQGDNAKANEYFAITISYAEDLKSANPDMSTSADYIIAGLKAESGNLDEAEQILIGIVNKNIDPINSRLAYAEFLIYKRNDKTKAEEQLQIALNNAQTESEKEYINKMITEYNLK